MGFLDKLLGRTPAVARHLGRNDPCWCGSGKKYKRCHLEKDKAQFSREDAERGRCTSYG